MMRALIGMIGLVLAGMCSAAPAAEQNAPAPDGALPQIAPVIKPVAKSPAAASALFNKPVSLRGTLGAQQVQVNVRPKAEIDEGIEGEYFVFGRSQKILLAGELEGEDVFLEESENGTDVSGQWDGKRTGDVIQGNWLSADGTISKPFTLKIAPAEKPLAKARPLRLKQAKPARAD